MSNKSLRFNDPNGDVTCDIKSAYGVVEADLTKEITVNNNVITFVPLHGGIDNFYRSSSINPKFFGCTVIHTGPDANIDGIKLKHGGIYKISQSNTGYLYTFKENHIFGMNDGINHKYYSPYHYKDIQAYINASELASDNYIGEFFFTTPWSGGLILDPPTMDPDGGPGVYSNSFTQMNHADINMQSSLDGTLFSCNTTNSVFSFMESGFFMTKYSGPTPIINGLVTNNWEITEIGCVDAGAEFRGIPMHIDKIRKGTYVPNTFKEFVDIATLGNPSSNVWYDKLKTGIIAGTRIRGPVLHVSFDAYSDTQSSVTVSLPNHSSSDYTFGKSYDPISGNVTDANTSQSYDLVDGQCHVDMYIVSDDEISVFNGKIELNGYEITIEPDNRFISVCVNDECVTLYSPNIYEQPYTASISIDMRDSDDNTVTIITSADEVDGSTDNLFITDANGIQIECETSVSSYDIKTYTFSLPSKYGEFTITKLNKHHKPDHYPTLSRKQMAVYSSEEYMTDHPNPPSTVYWAQNGAKYTYNAGAVYVPFENGGFGKYEFEGV